MPAEKGAKQVPFFLSELSSGGELWRERHNPSATLTVILSGPIARIMGPDPENLYEPDHNFNDFSRAPRSLYEPCHKKTGIRGR